MWKSMPIIVFALFLGSFFLQHPVQAASWGSDTQTGTESRAMKAGRKAVEKEKFTRAVRHLTEAVEETPDNADAHNLLGYSHRKLGNTDKAFEHYNKALALEPEHRGANEYLGELYLETDQLDKAEERLKVLDEACFFPCKEYTDLKNAITEYKSKRNIK